SGSETLLAGEVIAGHSRRAGEDASRPTYYITTALLAAVAGALSNYNVTNAGAEFTIDKRDATWTTNPNSKIYGNVEPSPLTTGSGDFLPADEVRASYSREAGENARGRTYHITGT